MGADPAQSGLKNFIQDLDPERVPSAEPQAQRKRLVIVGDVHGRLAQLQKLLQKINFDRSAGDHLVFTGDLVNKGPDIPGVVQLAIDLGASAVRGNNEDRVLAAHGFLKSGRVSAAVDDNGGPGFEDSSKKVPEDIPFAISSDYITATQLSDEHISWLSSLPLILRLGSLKGATSPPWNAGSIVVAHGGLVPLVPLEEQDPWAVMNMRSLVYPSDEPRPEAIQKALAKRTRVRLCRRAAFRGTKDEELDAELSRVLGLPDDDQTFEIPQDNKNVPVPIEAKDGKLWRDAWNEAQNLIEAPEQRTVVVYGHDARAGLQVQMEVEIPGRLKETGVKGTWTRYAFGMDSGATYGNELSAMVIEPSPDMKDIVHRIEQVKET